MVNFIMTRSILLPEALFTLPFKVSATRRFIPCPLLPLLLRAVHTVRLRLHFFIATSGLYGMRLHFFIATSGLYGIQYKCNYDKNTKYRAAH